jgi:hypothetical protein
MSNTLVTLYTMIHEQFYGLTAVIHHGAVCVEAGEPGHKLTPTDAVAIQVFFDNTALHYNFNSSTGKLRITA